jgi:uncharacterized cupredoxin-like copper-binding protein
MFTTGSKLFFGITFISIVAAVVHGVVTGDLAGVIILSFIAVTAAFLGGFTVWMRDANPRLTEQGVAAVPSASPVGGTMWPLVGGLSLTMTALGLAIDRRIFGVGIVLLVATIAEWMVQSWADRASADPAYNAKIRGRLAHPVEIPVLGFVVIAAVLFGFSRIMLSLSETGAIILFSAVGIAILATATALALRQATSHKVLVAIGATGLTLLAVGAIIGVNRGEHYFVAKAEGHEKKEKPNEAVAAKSNPLATVRATKGSMILEHDGGLIEEVTVPKGIAASVIFRNDTGEKAKLVVESVVVKVDDAGVSKTEPFPYATEEIETGKVKYLTFVMPKAGKYKMMVEGESGEIASREFEVLA